MKAEDLVKLMDSYMENGGSYIKPKIDEKGNETFLVSKDNKPKSEDDLDSGLEVNIENTEIFTGRAKYECAACADIPNISDIDKK